MTSANINDALVAEEKHCDDDVFIEEGVDADSPAEDTISGTEGRLSTASKQLSTASKSFDLGNKGFLTPSERQLRSYDADGSGNLDVAELKNIVHDLNGTLKSKKLFQKLAGAAAACGGFMLLANFGLIWTGLILARQISTNNGQLVEAKSGAPIAVKGQGHHTKLEVNPDFVAEFNELNRRHLLGYTNLPEDGAAWDEAVRRLQSTAAMFIPGCPDAQGNTRPAKDCVNDSWQDYVNGVLESFSFDHDGVTYTGSVATGASQTILDQCHEYNNVRSTDDEPPYTLYRISCCGTEDCGVFVQEASSLNCVSAVATVVEETKGKMLYKDLKRGDAILSSGGIYRPVVTVIHSNHIAATTFLQIHTASTKYGPLEITEDHLMFLDKMKLPVRAGEVKVGDEVITVDGPKLVTQISSVKRTGIYSVLTYDSTHFVDGMLASSMTTQPGLEDGVTFKFGPTRIHAHTLFKIAAPLCDWFCTNINSLYCESVSDGHGGEANIITAKYSENTLLLVPTFAAGVIFSFMYTVSYYLACAMACPALSIWAIALIKIRATKTKNKAL